MIKIDFLYGNDDRYDKYIFGGGDNSSFQYCITTLEGKVNDNILTLHYEENNKYHCSEEYTEHIIIPNITRIYDEKEGYNDTYFNIVLKDQTEINLRFRSIDIPIVREISLLA